MDDSENYYFDGYTDALMQWPSPPAFVSKIGTALSMVPSVPVEEDMEECVEEYYDITGDPLCWISSSSRSGLDLEEMAFEEDAEEIYSYFDERGSREWRDYDEGEATNVHRTILGDFNEDASEDYYYHW
jgi:hypothetical protein